MRFLKRFVVPATETQVGLALAMSMVVMALLLWAIIWESNVITYQRDLIRAIWNWRYGG